MKVLADASVDLRLVRQLRTQGVDVEAIIETAATTVDPEVLGLAMSIGAILITEDKDFGELVFKKGLQAAGVILIRTRVSTDQDIEIIANRILRALATAEHAFVTLTPKQARRRPLP